jgi:hypothetical protein
MAFKVDPSRVAKKAAEEAAKAAAFDRQNVARIYWKPKQGKNQIRILPPWTDQGQNAGLFWREISVHWGVGADENNVHHLSCPKETPPGGGECPVCDEYERFKSSSDPAEKEAARELRPKSRSYSNIIDMDSPTWTAADVAEFEGKKLDSMPEVGDPKVQVFSYGPKILKELLDLFCADPEICDLKEGRTIHITREGKDLKTEYRVRPDLKQTPVPFKGEPELHNLDDLMPLRPVEEMLAILQGIDPDEAKKLAQESKKEERKALPSGNGKSGKRVFFKVKDLEFEEVEAPEEAAEESVEDEVQAAEEEIEAAAPEEEKHPWLDSEGAYAVPEGYPTCFGFERDITDSVCTTECQAFKECRDAVIFRCQLDGSEPPKNALEPTTKKNPAKKPVKQPQKTAKKADDADEQQGLGSKAVASMGEAGKAASPADALAARMRAAIDQAR